MSQEAKRIKILTLVALIGGLALMGCAIALAVTGTPVAVSVLIGLDGLASTLFGGRGALIANVPARMGKLASLAIIVLVVQVALVAGLVYAMGPDHVADEPLPVVVSVAPAIVTLIILLLSRGMAKRAER